MRRVLLDVTGSVFATRITATTRRRLRALLPASLRSDPKA